MKSLRYFSIMVVLFTLVCIGAYLAVVPDAIAPFISSMLMIVLPLGLGIFLARRLKADWRFYGIGMLTFIGSQVVHIPFNSWTLVPLVERLGLNPTPGSIDLVWFSLLLGVSAGVFEETARFIVYRRWLEKARAWKDGLMFGAGHGGIEAMFLGVLALLGFLNFLTLRSTDLSAVVPPENLESTQLAVEAYWNTAWNIQLLPLLERISAMVFHLSAALLVMQAVVRRNLLWYAASILWHTFFNAGTLFALRTWGVVQAETLVFVAGVLSLGIIIALRPKEETEIEELSSDAPVDQSVMNPSIPDKPDPLTSEKLESSRYD